MNNSIIKNELVFVFSETIVLITAAGLQGE